MSTICRVAGALELYRDDSDPDMTEIALSLARETDACGERELKVNVQRTICAGSD